MSIPPWDNFSAKIRYFTHKSIVSLHKNLKMKIYDFRTLLLFVVMAFSCTDAICQKYNNTDKQGRRQGKWIEYFDNGKVKFEGQFKNDIPCGEFVYYDESGAVKARNKYSSDGSVSDSEMYSASGKVVAQGKYVNRKKDGLWRFFSEKDGSLILEENYVNGLPNGKSVAFLNDVVIEEVNYLNGVKHGSYNKYYDSGVQMITATYKNGFLDGAFVTYYPNGMMNFEGVYRDGEKVGEWKTYDEEGNVVSTDIHQIENYNDPALKGVELD